MRFSIIVPAYQAEGHIQRCIDSILSQDYADYEIIIVDDGSRDDTLKACRALEKIHSQIRVVSKENGGASSARNMGIRISRGDYLLFLDSDDFWINNTLLSSLSKCISLKGADLILFGVKTQNASNGKSKTRVQFSVDDINFLETNSLAQQTEFLVSTSKFPSSAWSLAVRANLIKTNELYFKEGIVAEDIDWVISLFFHDIRVSAIEGVFHQYHKFRPGSVTSESGAKAVESLMYIVEKWAPRLRGPGLRDKALKSFLAFHYSTIFLSYYKLQPEKKRALKPKVRQYSWLLKSTKSRRLDWVRRILKIFGIHWGSILLSSLYRTQLKYRV